MKLNCEVMGDLLPLYAEGLTTPATNELVEEHLADCPDCRAALEDMKQAPPPLPEDTLPLRQVRNTLQIRRRASVLLAAALVLVVALVALAHLTKPVYLGYQGNSDTLVQVEELADGRYCVTFDDSVTGYRLETVETEAGKNLALVMIWYTPLDRLLGKSLQGIEQQGLLLDADTDYFYLVTPLGGDAAYYPVETWEGAIPEGPISFAGLMPRLALNYYALLAAAAAAVLGIFWLLLRKKRAGKVFRTLFWLPVAYVLAHLCIMGTDGRTYQMQWDFALIALTALAIYAALLAVWTLLPKRRVQSETPAAASPRKPTAAPQRKRPAWVKWGAIAACLCVLVGVLALPRFGTRSQPTGTSADVGQTQFLSEAEELSVEIVEWKTTGFAAVVVDVGNNSVFPLDGELSVEFGYETEILLADGTTFEFDPDEPDAEAVGWEIGTVVKVQFTEYDDYLEGNHFYNRLLADSVEAAATE